MDSNVYKTPEAPVSTTASVDVDALCDIGRRQKLMIWALGIQYALGVIGRAFEGEVVLMVLGVLALLALGNVVVSVVRLSVKLNHPVVTVLVALLAFLPLINLLVMLFLSRRSTSTLKAHGVHVGLMGASEQDIRTKAMTNPV